MLKYQQERQSSAQIIGGPENTGTEASAPKLNSVINGESLEDIRKVGQGSKYCCRKCPLVLVFIWGMEYSFARHGTTTNFGVYHSFKVSTCGGPQRN